MSHIDQASARRIIGALSVADERTFGITLECDGRKVEVTLTHAQASDLVNRFASHGIVATPGATS